jgi:hypothetical protein
LYCLADLKSSTAGHPDLVKNKTCHAGGRARPVDDAQEQTIYVKLALASNLGERTQEHVAFLFEEI